MDSRNLETVKELYRAMQEDGLRRGGEYLAVNAHEEARIRLYTTGERVLEGRDEIRSYFAEAEAGGTSVVLRAREYEERGDEVVVTGSARVLRAEGGFAETQVRWTWVFEDGLIKATRWEPRSGD